MSFKFQDHVIYEQLTLFVKDIYDLTGKLPAYEQSGLITTLRQLSNSLLQDYAAGFTRTPDNNVQKSLNSCIEKTAKIASLIDLCFHLGYITQPIRNQQLLSCEDLTKRLYEQLKSSK